MRKDPQRFASDRDHLFKALLEQRLDDLFLVGELSVGSAHPDAGPVGNVFQRDVEHLLGEQFACCSEQKLSVERRVPAQCGLSG
jgi:hypothetical protein